MFDIGLPEMFIIGVLALIVVGPKDLPKTIKMVTTWIRKARMMARDFQSGVDEMVRESELGDVKKQLTEGSSELKKELESTVGTDIAKDLDLSEDEAKKVVSDSDADLDLDEVMEPSDASDEPQTVAPGDSSEALATEAAPDVDEDDDVMPISEPPAKTETTS